MADDTTRKHEELTVRTTADLPGFGPDDVLDPRRYMEDGFREQYYRSQDIRQKLYDLAPMCLATVTDILRYEMTEKTMPVMLAAAKFALESNMLKQPDVQHQLVELRDRRSNQEQLPAPPPVSREEVIEAAIVAMEAERHKGEKASDE